MRNLYRIEAIVDEKTLHRALLTFADMKALNVSVMPVTTPQMNGAHAPQAAPPPQANGAHVTPTAKTVVRLFAANQKKPFGVQDVVDASPEDVSRQSIHQALWGLGKDGELKSLGKGKYRRTAKLQPPATRAEAPLKKGTGFTIIADVLTAAGAPMKRPELRKACVERGMALKSVDSTLYLNKDKLTRTDAGYSLRGDA